MIAEVIVDVSTSELDRIFDYEGDAPLGSRVLVEFGRQRTEGFVIGLKETSNHSPLKPILKVLEGQIKQPLLELMPYMIKKYNLRYVDVLRLFVPSELRSGKVGELSEYSVSLNPALTYEEILAGIRKNASAQIGIVEYLKGQSSLKTPLNAKFGNAAVKSLLDKGLLVEEEQQKKRVPYINVDGAELAVKLKKSQQDIVDNVLKAIDSEDPSKRKFLIHGVTGSGKTEVYMAIVQEVLKKGKTAIMLVPEISLTPQILRLMRAKFDDKVAILHSGLSAGERLDEWLRLSRGEAKIAVGARSAIFAPLENLGVIVIDEEHDSSYISESNPRYDTKEIAEMRAGIDGAALVLGSATPDIGTYLAAEHGAYQLMELPERISGAELPEMEIIDMVAEIRAGNRGIFSVRMKEELAKVLEKGEQAMIFINRRGFASFVMCRECGYVAKCSDCDISLTYHKEDNQLKCHYCGKRYEMLSKCPECGNAKLREGRVGTETVCEELKKLFPGVRLLRMDNDTTTGKDSHLRILSDFGDGKADILVGTQMIAKGHDFKNVTLVGILDADFSLYLSDYRSAERVFQLVTQVAGRAGRADKKGIVLLQTYAPKHYVFRYAKGYDYRGFFRKECNSRQVTKFPPYSRIMRVLVTSADEQDAMDAAKNIYREIKDMQKDSEDFIYLQAMRSPVKRIKKRFRYQILMRLKNKNADEIAEKIYRITDKYKSSKLICFVETNPQSLV